MQVIDRCNPLVISATPQTGIAEAARLMRDYHVGCLPIVDDSVNPGVVVGMLTDRDMVVEALAQDVPLNELQVADIMSGDPETANEYDDCWETVQRMFERGIRRMPVLDSNGRLVGIFALDDALQLLSETLNRLSGVPYREMSQEEHSRR